MLKKLEHALPDHPDMLTIYALDTLPRRDGRTEMVKLSRFQHADA